MKFSLYKDKVLRTYRTKHKQWNERLSEPDTGTRASEQTDQREVGRIREDFPGRVIKARSNLYLLLRSSIETEERQI